MARAACNFRQRDVAAAVKAVRSAGVESFRVEIEGGRISIIVAPSLADSDTEDLDRELAEFKARQHEGAA